LFSLSLSRSFFLSQSPCLRSLLLPLLTTEQSEQLQKNKSLDLCFLRGSIGRFRANIHYQRGTLAASIRLLPAQIPSLESLHLPAVLAQLTERRQGLVLVTGPTGSGKTSTIAALIDLINARRRDHIITIEDPIEYFHKHNKCLINQREIGIDVPDFPEAIRRALRMDPDIILVGDTSLAQESRIRLARVGFDRVIGQLDDVASVFTRFPHLFETAARFTPVQLAELLNDEPGLQIVDVRNPGETEEGIVPGAQEIPLPTLTESLENLDPRVPVITYCASGYRSLIAASLLRAVGFENVGDLLGGYQAWDEAGLAF